MKDTPEIPHNPEEFDKLLSLLEGAKSILEIGSRCGKTLAIMARTMGQGRVVSVDLPNGPWGLNSETDLRKNMEELKNEGFDTHLFLTDSLDENTIESVRLLAPYDLIFIDGDHHYKGVKADWVNYGPMGKIVVFHDIESRSTDIEVYKLWAEIEGNKEEFIADGSRLGLGIYRV